MIIYDRGSAVLLEVEFKKRTPFVGDALFDPASSTITITDNLGTVRVSAASLTQSATGQWYYICQSEVTWRTGEYKVVISASDGTNADITSEQAFELQ
jgi:hypothetical protein